jgi:hypothetical protein
MGNYNPYAPKILGQEWVPIRDENLILQPGVNAFEVGHKFTLATSRQVRDLRFYTNEMQQNYTAFQAAQIGIYPFGAEDQTGPISQVLIPCNNGGMTGSNFSISGASTIAEALLQAGDGKYVQATYNSGSQQEMSLFFAVNPYVQLANKRILNVSLAYCGMAQDQDALGNQVSFVDPDPLSPATVAYIRNDTNTQSRTYQKFWAANTGSLSDLNSIVLPGQSSTAEGQHVSYLNLGDLNIVWGSQSGSQSEILPWRFVDLQKFEASAGVNRLHIHLIFQVPLTDNGTFCRIFLEYAALRVTYCEERRVAYGGKLLAPYTYGMNAITVRDLSQNADPILPPGDYLATIASVNPGDVNYGSGTNSTFPKMNALRQLYEIPPHPGVKVNVPFPAQDNVGKVFTSERIQVLPQLTLHSSGGPLTEVHAYGRQVAAQVYGSITATQEIYDDVVGVSTVYDQVRFYARRFGDTSVPLVLTGSGSLSGSSVSITPSDFDALTEIINGWREVTLTFTTPPTMGTLVTPNPAWIWSATGEIAGNRWEVLGADAPALSGIPGNLYNLVPSPNQLYEATYQPPGGSQAELNWMPQGIGSLPVTGNSDDDSADATLIFAVNPLPITGFSVTTQTQELVGIGLDCGVDPCCIPTDILYNRITWGLPVNTGVASDDFNRVVAAGGWGTASDGHVWTTSGTAANFSVNGSEGIIAPTATASDRFAWVNVGGPDQDAQALVRIADTAETSSLNIGLTVRLTDASNYYGLELRQNSTGTLTLLIRKRVAGVATDLLSMTVASLNASSTAWRNLRFQVQGTILRAKVWGANDDEPEWMLAISDTSLTTGNNAGVFARDNTTAAAPSSFMFDSFSVNPPDYGFGAYELQRMDTVTTDWQTIMRATAVATTGFSDFEARAGITSTYRIRGLDVYDFAGPWSSEVAIALPAPGVSGGCLEGGHVLIFTSNERQDGSINLAYSSVWEDRVEEDFSFAEAGFVQLQAMYNRDFFTAFRPTERGGEQFQRTVLVQAAAISPETLADFTSLRDMAWEDVSYICVRDEDGNRWFATVIVPSGKVTNSRKLYMAPVQIIEVTDTPSEVDP